MSVAHEPQELLRILSRAKRVSPDHPAVVSKFETHAREFEIDAVADQGKIVCWAMSEHIENAGTHSGDATLVVHDLLHGEEVMRLAHRHHVLRSALIQVNGGRVDSELDRAEHRVLHLADCLFVRGVCRPTPLKARRRACQDQPCDSRAPQRATVPKRTTNSNPILFIGPPIPSRSHAHTRGTRRGAHTTCHPSHSK